MCTDFLIVSEETNDKKLLVVNARSQEFDIPLGYRIILRKKDKEVVVTQPRKSAIKCPSSACRSPSASSSRAERSKTRRSPLTFTAAKGNLQRRASCLTRHHCPRGPGNPASRLAEGRGKTDGGRTPAKSSPLCSESTKSSSNKQSHLYDTPIFVALCFGVRFQPKEIGQ